MSDSQATGRGLAALLDPASVVVIGASDDASKFGGRVVRLLTDHGFDGDLHFVTRDGREVGGRPSSTSVQAVGAAVDAAVIVVPAVAVPGALEDCAAAGVSAAVIISGGFREVGREGVELEARLRSIVDASGIRVIGPNCLGAVNPHRRLALTSSVSLAEVPMYVGDVALVSQSGAMMVSLIDWLRARERGVSAAVSLGNQVDVDAADMLDLLAVSPETKAVAAVIEATPDPERYLSALRRCADNGKPVVVLKIGRTSAGIDAAAAHTASFAGSYDVFRAATEREGAVLVDDPMKLVVVAEALAATGQPRAGGVGLISSSGGANGIIGDAATERGLTLAGLAPSTVARLGEYVQASQARNPIDLGACLPGIAHDEAAAAVATAMADDPAVAVLVLALSSSPNVGKVAAAVADAAAASGKPLFGLNLLGAVGDAPRRALAASGALSFERIDDALESLEALAGRAAARGPATSHWGPPIELAGLPDLAGALSEQLSKALLERAGITCNRGRVAVSVDDAVAAADELGYPVVMKVASPAVVHKSDIGGVVLGLADADAVRSAWKELSQRFVGDPDATLHVQEQVQSRGELLVGARRDAQFGTVVVVGAGGALVHVLDDVQLRLVPVSAGEAHEMLRGLRMWPVLAGTRGQSPVDLAALAQAIARFSELAAALGERLRELEINPLMIDELGGRPIAVDARGHLAGAVAHRS